MENRAYSILTVKDITERDDDYLVRGLATSPASDRMDDIVEPMGGEYKLPLPLLWQHQASQPVGRVISARATKAGIPVEISLPKVKEEGNLKDRIDEAVQSIKYRLVTGLSIGFRALQDGVEVLKNGGLRFTKWEWLELSLVTIPANSEATLNLIKSIDTSLRAATGHADSDIDRPKPPGVTGKRQPVNLKPKEGKNVKTITEQITALEKMREIKSARMNEIQNGVAEAGRTKDASEKEEFDTLRDELKSIDDELVDLRHMEKINVSTAKPAAGETQEKGTEARRPGTVIEVRNQKVQKGIPFVRMVSALAMARGNRFEAAQIADSKWKDSTPEVAAAIRMSPIDIEMLTKTAVAAGTTSDSTWAAPLVQYNNLASEFIEYLRPLTIIGQINGFRRVPFKVKVPRQTGAATVNWVGEGKVKPVTSLAFDSVTLDFAKIAGIIPLTEELVRLSSPSAEQLVRDDLAAAIGQFMDNEFIDPNNASTDVSPASITYGLSPTVATGTTAAAFRADAKTMFATLLQNNSQIGGGVWVMTQQQAVAFSLMQTSLGTPEFPGITPVGGTLIGFPVVATENIPSYGGSPADGYPITFILPREILLADDGGVTIDVSREASLQMDTSPDSPNSASTVLVSLWQQNMIAIKAERFINWKTRRTYAAGVIQGAKYAE